MPRKHQVVEKIEQNKKGESKYTQSKTGYTSWLNCHSLFPPIQGIRNLTFNTTVDFILINAQNEL